MAVLRMQQVTHQESEIMTTTDLRPGSWHACQGPSCEEERPRVLPATHITVLVRVVRRRLLTRASIMRKQRTFKALAALASEAVIVACTMEES